MRPPGRLKQLNKFQSAPRSEERGDGHHHPTSPQKCCFNPRPAPKSGAIQTTSGQTTDQRVSIRAPLRRAGRWHRCGYRRQWRCFNPRPAPKSGAMTPAFHESSQGACFNPRPAPKSGAISTPALPFPALLSFNPRPAPKSGAIYEQILAEKQANVSIRAPLRRAGRCKKAGASFVPAMFQSAPRSEERGDTPAQAREGAVEVSIRAPLRRAGRCAASQGAPPRNNVSIRAPLRRAGRYPELGLGSVFVQVSIRAPLRRAGRYDADV